ncbi:MAG: ribonuclease Z [Gemmatimonadetes bacterium]|nr:ribonuclease Z [Gemmatimonadota bacterium]NNM05962.1 ribonuclease Z [Gemmatimonadota bacterium]
MKLWVVGSGTFIPNPYRGSAAHWLEGDHYRFLMDCGPGTLRALARLGLPWHDVTHVFVTHFHMDHVGDLSYLLFSLRHGQPTPRESGLTILGPRGLGAHLTALASAHGGRLLDPGFPISIQELDPGQGWRDPSVGLRVSTVKTPHTENSLGIRLETDDGHVGFTGDTEPSPDLGLFFRGCDVLLAECSTPDGGEVPGHLSPKGLASLARTANPGLLVPVHFYPSLEPESVPSSLKDGGFEGWVLPGWDGLCVDLTHGVVTVEPSH